jgi:hypothetical protein
MGSSIEANVEAGRFLRRLKGPVHEDEIVTKSGMKPSTTHLESH